MYVHVPFCSAICPYCDFAVTTGDAARRARYVEHLLTELELSSELSDFDTLYLGGGTPSLLTHDQLAALRQRARLADDCRVFLEANPEDINDTSVAHWRELGVATLSLGVQSFDDDALTFLGRRHRAPSAELAIETARGAGFDTLSIDLIYGLPGQSVDDWRRTLDAGLSHEPDHISCYQLTIHDETPFGRRKREGKLVEIDNDRQADLFLETHRYLGDHGYVGYEVSNFARAVGHRSRHNQKYWNHTPYLGVGPSAHSFDGRIRSWNERALSAWEQSLDDGRRPVDGKETLSDEQLLLETIVLRMRTLAGLDFDDIIARFDVDLHETNRGLIERWCEEGLVTLEGSGPGGKRLCPTLRGLAVADSLASSFQFPDPRCQLTPR